ncbi:hypothetical protein [Nocardioides sp.]|uniref:hypothetical protein n=1 Tax=Nocardioides sp. TaxID=35761 RepID=UPI0031FF1A5E
MPTRDLVVGQSGRVLQLGEHKLKRRLPASPRMMVQVHLELEPQRLVDASPEQTLELVLHVRSRDHEAQLDAIGWPEDHRRLTEGEHGRLAGGDRHGVAMSAAGDGLPS